MKSGYLLPVSGWKIAWQFRGNDFDGPHRRKSFPHLRRSRTLDVPFFVRATITSYSIDSISTTSFDILVKLRPLSSAYLCASLTASSASNPWSQPSGARMIDRLKGASITRRSLPCPLRGPSRFRAIPFRAQGRHASPSVPLGSPGCPQDVRVP